MSHDFDDGILGPPTVTAFVPQATDLEAIVMLLELAQLTLTPQPGATFTMRQLFDEAHGMGGEDIALDERDMLIVVDHMPSLKSCITECGL